MKSALLVDVKFDSFNNFDALRKALPGHRIIDWSDAANRPTDLAGIHYALGWQPDQGLFAAMPDLKVMFSLGAGVDHILADKSLPDLPLVRFVDSSLTSRMSEWICLQSLLHLRQHWLYDRQQAARIWRDHPQPDACDVRVGIMGMGVLGQDSARKLQALGFQVNGWSRTKKNLPGVECYDQSGLDEFLAKTDILVGLLPLTPQTTEFFNADLFAKLPATTPIGAPVFINAGRGKSQVETDIIDALKSGRLKGVSLDVFEREPLAKGSALWGMDNVFLTPHVASVSDSNAVANHVARQIERFEAGLELQHIVDKKAGY